MLRRLLLFSVLTGWCFTVLAATPLKTFTSGSYQAILKQQQGMPFILVLWSLDCPPCHEELGMLVRLNRQQSMELVLVSIDGVEAGPDIKQILQELGMNASQSWVFAEASSLRLQYEIDPGWYGVVPRSYLFDTSHQRRTVTGILKPETVQQWLGLHHRL